MLSEPLKAVIAQTLCRSKDGRRVAAFEILLVYKLWLATKDFNRRLEQASGEQPESRTPPKTEAEAAATSPA